MDIADVCGQTTRITVSEDDVRDLGDQKRTRPVINDLANFWKSQNLKSY